MKVALVASSYLPARGRSSATSPRSRGACAPRGAGRGAHCRAPLRGLPPVSESDGVVVRRLPAPDRPSARRRGRRLWEHLRRSAASFDLVHAHSAHVLLALAVARSGPRRFVFTPHAPIQRLLRWPYARTDRGASSSVQSKPSAPRAQRPTCCVRGFRGRAPGSASYPAAWTRRGSIGPSRSGARHVVLTVGRLEAPQAVDRAIAAMASLDPGLGSSSRATGPPGAGSRRTPPTSRSPRALNSSAPSDPELYRWLRTARVLVALSEQDV